MSIVKSEEDSLIQSIAGQVVKALDEAYELASLSFAAGTPLAVELSPEFRSALDTLSAASKKASSVFTNIITCLTIKIADPSLDMRVHQVQIGAPFNFRSVSEKTVYPWLDSKHFETAQSGWQTRTLERPKPYTMDYAENIQFVKTSFLKCFQCIEEGHESPFNALSLLLFKQMELRESKKIALATPTIDEIEQIVQYFEEHFFKKYQSKGASRLPVLAIYSVYEAMIGQVSRYRGKALKPLKSHSAADSQTGAVGDIEVQDVATGAVFEALEIKHNHEIGDTMIDEVSKKIGPYQLNRYYLLTTHEQCKPSVEHRRKLQQVKIKIGCQVIVNGVLPSLRYYLRLLENPNVIFPIYARLLNSDKAISHEHRVAWSTIVTNIVD